MFIIEILRTPLLLLLAEPHLRSHKDPVADMAHVHGARAVAILLEAAKRNTVIPALEAEYYSKAIDYSTVLKTIGPNCTVPMYHSFFTINLFTITVALAILSLYLQPISHLVTTL